MIDPYKLGTGDVVYLVREHIVSIQVNPNGEELGSVVRMVNGDQWAPLASPETIVEEWGRREWGRPVHRWSNGGNPDL